MIWINYLRFRFLRHLRILVNLLKSPLQKQITEFGKNVRAPAVIRIFAAAFGLQKNGRLFRLKTP